MRIRAGVLSVAILIVIFGGIALTSGLNLWRTTNSKEPAKYSAADLQGQYNPADIRGSSTMEEISRFFEIPLEDLGRAFFGAEETNYAILKCKDVEARFSESKEDWGEVGTSSVRYFVAAYKGLPYTLTEEIFLPEEAVEILKAKAQLSAEQLEYLARHSVPMP